MNLQLNFQCSLTVFIFGVYRRRRKEYIESILGSGRGPKEVYKTSQKKIINEMRTERGDIVTNREEVLKVCAHFYQDLYSSQTQNQPTTTKILSPDNSDAPPFLNSEIKRHSML